MGNLYEDLSPEELALAVAMPPRLIGRRNQPLAGNDPSRFQLTILRALQDKPMYMGTVSRKTRALRRAAGKVAKRSRKINRGLPDRRH